jgi:spore germination cell wall hydrolase CwlJ-like protein
MRTLNYVKVAVFALTIGVTLYIASQINFATPQTSQVRQFDPISSVIDNNKRTISFVPTAAAASMKIDEYWLALNIYYEAASESRVGKMAVGIVTLNRVNDPRYPKTVKDVVTEKNQFSWYNDRVVKAPANKEAWQECLQIAKMLLTKGADNDIMLMLEGATHYHATYVKPPWAKTKTKIVQIGEHIFYRFERNDDGRKI